MDAAVIDREALLAEFDGDEELLTELVQTMKDEAPKLMYEVRVAVANADAAQVARAAHTLKGAVSNFGARDTADAALQLEQIGRSGNLGDLASAVAVLETEMSAFEKALALI